MQLTRGLIRSSCKDLQQVPRKRCCRVPGDLVTKDCSVAISDQMLTAE